MMHSLTKRRLLAAAQAVLLAATGLAGCHSKPDATQSATPPPVPVLTQMVGTSTQNETVSVSGALEADRTVNIGFQIGGRVKQVNVEEGQAVRAGQVLASLDASSYQFALNASDATLTRAQDEYARLKLMYDRGSLTASDLEAARTAVAQAQAQQQQNRKNVRDGQVVAPMAGRVAKRGTNPGEMVGPGTPLFTIVTGGRLVMRAAVPEAEIRQVHPGLLTQVAVPALDSTFTGRIEAVAPVADPASRTYSVKITLANPQGLLRPGMIAEARIVSTQREQVLAIPGEAIVRDPDQLTYVFVADPQRKQAFRRRVQVGAVQDKGVVITSGLQGGERVVVGGQNRLRDGAPITLTTSPQ